LNKREGRGKREASETQSIGGAGKGSGGGRKKGGGVWKHGVMITQGYLRKAGKWSTSYLFDERGTIYPGEGGVNGDYNWGQKH